ncbi:MAG: tRNA uridine-5-carboxymethylaminomethyl(34) synthesis GTPase MnmE [Thermoanaerobaculia bacterium]|nr:tRNA uridine-5-carboxymethylaminomethyl(34) synthesis GTPase MnmE [Thermoanaerobaculia bacterium]
MSELDTIVAPATPVGRSALAVVRIDGPLSGQILATLSGSLPEERKAAFTRIRQGGEPIDECVAIFYKAPRSFTGNDLVELMLHGSPVIIERVIVAARQLGARIAEPGEFTERAVLNGKLDLVQAESIADLVDARTSLQAKLSLLNVEGRLSRTCASIRESLLHVISRLEAALDFSEEGYEFITRADARMRLEAALAEIRAVADTYERGRATRAGITAVILGQPNAGKSTLLNTLVGSERAIVTPIPGTTRDIVRETIEIGGLPMTFLDTAGLREHADLVEEIGIRRARDASRSADIVLYLIDATRGADAYDEAEIAALAGRHVVVVQTKRDLAASSGLAISAATGEGMRELIAHLDAIVRERFAVPEASPSIVNERQRAAVAECESGLSAALDSIAGNADEQFIVVDLYRAANALGTLTGAVSRDDVLREIFSKFCIGK